MTPEFIGISGSPIPHSNTDRIIQHMLEATGRPTEFVKLSRLSIRPCLGCKQCVEDNICKVKDDFPALAETLKSAQGIIIGAYTPYSQIDAFTKALLERFWSLRHVNHCLAGKQAATVVTGLNPAATEAVTQAMKLELEIYEGMVLAGQLQLPGNLPCVTCGRGDDCPQSGKPLLHGPDTPCDQISYARVEDRDDLWKKAQEIGGNMAKASMAGKH